MTGPYLRYIESVFSDTLCNAVNKVAQDNATVREALAEMEGKKLCITLTNVRYSYALTAIDGVLLGDDAADVAPDLTVAGRLEDFLKVLASRNLDPTQLQDIEIDGDVKLAQRLFQIFSRVEFDWEEEIARRFGDVPARRIGNVVRWSRDNVIGPQSRLAGKIRDYAQNEAFLVPSRDRVRKFMDDVDTLKADVDRMGKRIQRLKDKR